ncbi:MAG TPA: hypothetical protein VM802_07415 [Chitinophaga sp.]|uniref:hypothetical protein n=1 Tax=Chitinophaga sp. TaxID=1869181 RepID=UPI002BC19A34|nr:hypothetical protein [Chitinophaga sp.]HVI44680.1 hypothetical protein [Chitinophaga sp.]
MYSTICYGSIGLIQPHITEPLLSRNITVIGAATTSAKPTLGGPLPTGITSYAGKHSDNPPKTLSSWLFVPLVVAG